MQKPDIAEHCVIHLIRHGETSSYRSDCGLTGRGRDQALEKGRKLGTTLSPETLFHIPHAPTARATETAALLATGLREAGARNVQAPYVEAAFDNFRVWCDDRALDPTTASREYRRIRDAGTEPPAWSAELERYLRLHDGDGDPIAFWLTHPLQHFEPASSVVRRFWAGVREAARRMPRGGRLLVSTHSGCLRAVATAALGVDLGEPENIEDVVLTIDQAGRRAMVAYRDASAEVRLTDGPTPPWHPR